MALKHHVTTDSTRNRPDQYKGERWKIGEVANRTGIGIETLRYYEKLGLLGKPARSSSGYRLYDSQIIERLDFIKRAQMLGFTLNEIGRIIAERQHGHSPCADVRTIVRQRLQEVDEKLKQLRRYRNELASALAQWDQIGEKEGHICGLIEESQIDHSLVDKHTTIQPISKKRGK